MFQDYSIHLLGQVVQQCDTINVFTHTQGYRKVPQTVWQILKTELFYFLKEYFYLGEAFFVGIV